MNIHHITSRLVSSTFKVTTKEGYLHNLSLQIAGKKRMEVSEFLRGFHAQDNLRVE